MIKILTLTFFLFYFLSSLAQAFTCSSILNTKPNYEPLSRLEQALDLLGSSEVNLSKEDILKFSHPKTGAVRVLKMMAKDLATGLIHQFWVRFEVDLFGHRDLEKAGYVQEVQILYSQYLDAFPTNLTAEVKDLSSKRRQRVAKLVLVRSLKLLTVISSEFYGKNYDLLTEEGLLKFFQAESKRELPEKLSYYKGANQDLNSRIKDLLEIDTNNPYSYRRFLMKELFGLSVNARLGFHPLDKSFFMRNASKREVVDLLKRLRLDAKFESEFLSKLDMVEGNYDRVRLHLMNGLILIKAYLLKYETIPSYTGREGESLDNIRLLYSHVRDRINRDEWARLREDKRFEDYLSQAETLNERYQVIEARLERRRALAVTKEDMEKVHEIEEAVSQGEVVELGLDLAQREEGLSRAERLLDELRETQQKVQDKEAITNFKDLDLDWSNIIPNRIYDFEGAIDFDKVVFTNRVVDYFSKDTSYGSRFLAFLSRAHYVVGKGASGLRALGSIHPQFRDIKILSKGVKLRLIGKLEGSTLYFFHVYDTGKPYNNPDIHRLVEDYNP